jgi:hypothetical protein
MKEYIAFVNRTRELYSEVMEEEFVIKKPFHGDECEERA